MYSDALKAQKYREKYPHRVWEDYNIRKQKGDSAKNCKNYFNLTLKGWATRCFTDIKKSPWQMTINRDDLIDLYKVQKGRCAVTGFKFKFISKNHCMSRPSVDRLDRNKGYNKDNIRLVWMWINMARNMWTDSQLIACAKLLAKHNYLDNTKLGRC